MGSSKRIILALCSKKVTQGLDDVSTALRAPPCGHDVAPPPLPDVLLPQLIDLIREKFDNFMVLQASIVEDINSMNDMLPLVECVFQIDGSGALMKEIIKRCANLRWFHNYLAGVDVLCEILNNTQSPRHKDMFVADCPDTLITNSKGVFSSSLKEYALAIMLHFCKNIDGLKKNQKNKIWKRFVMHELLGQTVGLIGFGDIAKHVATACKAMGMRCIACRRDPTKKDDLLDAVYGPEDNLKVYSESDFVVCSLPGTGQTRNSVSTAQFDAMKPSAVFISIGRGCVVDEQAIANALANKKIRGAAMDVFQVEPLSEKSRLWDIENLIISSHNADYYDDYSAKGVLQVFEKNLNRFINGVKVNNDMFTPIDPKLGY